MWKVILGYGWVQLSSTSQRLCFLHVPLWMVRFPYCGIWFLSQLIGTLPVHGIISCCRVTGFWTSSVERFTAGLDGWFQAELQRAAGLQDDDLWVSSGLAVDILIWLLWSYCDSCRLIKFFLLSCRAGIFRLYYFRVFMATLSFSPAWVKCCEHFQIPVAEASGTVFL